MYFYGPIAVILCINMILFIWTSITLWKEIPHERNNKLKVMRYKYGLKNSHIIILPKQNIYL